MNIKEQNLDARFMRRVRHMIEAGLIWHKHYKPWADEVVVSLDEPPIWALEICTLKAPRRALAALGEFLHTQPADTEQENYFYDEEYIACLFVSYESRAISWATFLKRAGEFADGVNGNWECEYFYCMLNDLEDSEFSTQLEETQRQEIEQAFTASVNAVRATFEAFRPYFQRYVTMHDG